MGAKVTPRQNKAIEALTQTGQVTQAAAAAGVARKTVYQWLRQDVFIQALDLATSEALAELSRQLVALGSLAADTLRGAMEDTEATPAARVRAADITINRLLQLRQLVDLEERVSRLEANK
jgi:hypothetical protein